MPTPDDNTPASQGRSPTRRRSPTRQRLIQVRRRRAVAGLSGLLVALICAIVVVAVTGGGSHHAVAVVRPPGGVSRMTMLTLRRRAAAQLSSREAAAIDRTLAYTPYVRMAGAQHREIALTFDDGPGPYSPEVLAVLRRLHTPATFFEIGEMLRYFGDSTREIVRMGDPIGDHTETHPPMNTLTRGQQRAELLDEAAAIRTRGAPFPRMFRPPYGVWNETTLQLLHHYRMLMVLWSVDTDDWERPGVPAIIHSALAGARPGAIILLHDAGGDRSETVAALPRIIRDLRRRGYRLVTVPKLLLDNPAPRAQDVARVRGQGG